MKQLSELCEGTTAVFPVPQVMASASEVTKVARVPLPKDASLPRSALLYLGRGKLDYSGLQRTPAKPKDLNDASLLHLRGAGRDGGPHNGQGLLFASKIPTLTFVAHLRGEAGEPA